MGKYDLWLQELNKAVALSNDPEDTAVTKEVARVYAQSGFRAAIAKETELQKQLAKRRYVDPGYIAYE